MFTDRIKAVRMPPVESTWFRAAYVTDCVSLIQQAKNLFVRGERDKRDASSTK